GIRLRRRRFVRRRIAFVVAPLVAAFDANAAPAHEQAIQHEAAAAPAIDDQRVHAFRVIENLDDRSHAAGGANLQALVALQLNPQRLVLGVDIAVEYLNHRRAVRLQIPCRILLRLLALARLVVNPLIERRADGLKYISLAALADLIKRVAFGLRKRPL